MIQGGLAALEHLDHRAGAVSCRLYDSDSLFKHDTGVGGVVWWGDCGEESDVDAERELGHCLAAADLLAQVFGGGLGEGGDDAEAASIGDGGGHLSIANIHHATPGRRGCGSRVVCGHSVSSLVAIALLLAMCELWAYRVSSVLNGIMARC